MSHMRFPRLGVRTRLRESLTTPFGTGNTLWIYGCGRSGSTWLAEMLGDLANCSVWMEPGFGHLFARPAIPLPYHQSPLYVLGGTPEQTHPAIQAFVVAAIRARFPGVTSRNIVVLKDQNASVGAREVSAALPGSRFLALVRDPRDIVASMLDAVRTPGSWAEGNTPQGLNTVDAGQIAAAVAAAITFTLEAYEQHVGPKTLVHYEDLLQDTHGALTRVCRDLRLTATSAQLAEIAERHSWHAIPAELKGAGKFFRSASPGSWDTVLSSEESAAVETHAQPVIERFYSASGSRSRSL